MSSFRLSRSLRRYGWKLPSALVLCVLATGLFALPETVGWDSAACSAASKRCGSCPDYCNYQDPCPPEPEMPAVQCPISGPTDYCLYPGSGCPPGEQVSQYGSCCYLFNSPIIVDVASNGIDLTELEAGVPFQIGPGKFIHQVSWTHPESDDAWLALDRNGNGSIDSGEELFGTFTPQPQPSPGQQKQGFLALAVFDQPANGGNVDRIIDTRDAIFGHLRLWHDKNHNGRSESHELNALSTFNIVALDLDYKRSMRRDRHGNLFRYRGAVYAGRPGEVGKWAYDVFLRTSRMGGR